MHHFIKRQRKIINCLRKNIKILKLKLNKSTVVAKNKESVKRKVDS